MEKRQLIGTTTIVIVLFTILLLGGSTMPLIRLVDIEDARARRRSKKDVNLSKTEKMVGAAEGLWPIYLGGQGGAGRASGAGPCFCTCLPRSQQCSPENRCRPWLLKQGSLG
jgi:hypothetical protein